MNFTTEQITHMLSLQDELNSVIHPEWKTQGFEWNIAALAELVEIKEWLGWKWWKAGYQQGLVESNKKQIQIEVIDILHFWLSWELVQHEEVGTAVIADYLNPKGHIGSVEVAVYDMMQACVFSDDPSWIDLGHLIKAAGLDASTVYEIYLGKYTLNKFRQRHGYKTGEYHKHWLLPAISIEFQEDNWYLEKAIDEIKAVGHSVTIEEIDNRLEYWYGILEGGK
jgi:hypothetical protein